MLLLFYVNVHTSTSSSQQEEQQQQQQQQQQQNIEPKCLHVGACIHHSCRSRFRSNV
jgi:transcription initiation factor TFIID subunit TAF12